ncbi:hypothetical protein [Streptomyces violaceusniger]|uniref:hypothetical protein n=1 Tax=Streptomyces violaceusniger TaxID=68280 RepID=UPI00380C09E3
MDDRTDNGIGGAPDPGAPDPEEERQPPPPEAPATEWWRLPAQPPVPPPPAHPPAAPGEAPAAGADAPEAAPPAPPFGDPPGPVPEGLHSAHEIGAEIGMTIGEAVVAHLPDPHAAAARRGLDIRWMRLKINVPAVLVALVATWGGGGLADAMAHSVAESGPFALLGWILLPAIVVGLVLLTPVGGVLGRVLVDILRGVLQGVGRLWVRGWRMRGIGYVLRLVVAVGIWSVLLSVLRLTGRALIHLLTGA